MQKTVLPAPLLTPDNSQSSISLASVAPSSAQAPSSPAVDTLPQAIETSKPEQAVNQTADAGQHGVLQLSGEATEHQLQASQEMNLVTGNITKADAHWLRDASSLSLDEIAGRLRRLDELEQQTDAYVQKLNSAQAENGMLQKTAEQSLQLQYLGFGLAALFALAYGYARLRRAKPRADAAASSILFGDNLSAQQELERAIAPTKPAPKAKEPLARENAINEPRECKQLPPQLLTEPVEFGSHSKQLIRHAVAAEAAAASPEEVKILPSVSTAELSSLEAQQTTPFVRNKSWYRRLFSSAQPADAAFADSAVGAEILISSDDDRDERIDSVWEDSKDWLREERILAERESQLSEPAAIDILHTAPIKVLASSISPAASDFLDDLAPQPGQALIDYIRSLHRIVQRLLDQGQFGQAGIMLYEHVRLVPNTSPWAYLAFLSLYHEPTAKYLEMRQWFLERFGREAPHIGEERSNLALARGIADYQYSMAQLSQSWPGERAVLLLEEWLAVSNKRIFTLYAYNELFMLYDVLEDLHGVNGGTNFAALTA